MKRTLALLSLLPLLMCCTTEEENAPATRSAAQASSAEEAGVTIQVDTAWDGVNRYEF